MGQVTRTWVRVWLLLLAMAGVACTATAQGTRAEQGRWRAVSSTATRVTGDIAISGFKIVIDFEAFPIAQIREATSAELTAVFDVATAARSGNLYRLSIAPGKPFLHKGTICGSEEVQWMLTAVEGKSLRVAFFSGAAMPALTAEAMATGTELCTTFAYER